MKDSLITTLIAAMGFSLGSYFVIVKWYIPNLCYFISSSWLMLKVVISSLSFLDLVL